MRHILKDHATKNWQLQINRIDNIDIEKFTKNDYVGIRDKTFFDS